MLFTDPIYYFFLFVFSLLYLIVKQVPHRQFFLALVSALFCISFGWFSFFVLTGLCIINYTLLFRLANTKNKILKKWLYNVSVAFNVFFLIAYKSVQVAASNTLQDANFNHGDFVLLGLSFYVLQIIGYFFEVYKKRHLFSLSFLDFYLSVAFFCKLPEGPILQLPQATKVFNFDAKVETEANFSFGIQRILLGLFKKLVLADRLGFYVHQVFDEHLYTNGLTIYATAILFTIQLYLDFSGFIDIAIGSARLFGITLPENFNYPLRASSIIEFWRRWHITLVSWLTNYVFYPLSFRFRKYKKKGLIIAVIITFLISAFWHGIAVTFLIWGTCHIIFIIIEHWLVKNSENKTGLKKVLRIFVVWNLVSFANLFFRSKTFGDAIQLIYDLTRKPFFYGNEVSLKTWLINGGQDIETEFNFRLSIGLCILFLFLERKINGYANRQKYQVGYVAVLLILIAVFGFFNGDQNFIYTRF